MALDPLTAAFDAAKILIERIWPDQQKQAEEIRKLEEVYQRGDLAHLKAHTDILLAQIKVNEVSASHASIFVSGARPAAIWAGVASMAWAGLFHPIMTWVWATFQAFDLIPKELTPPPLIESAALASIVTGLLGLGAMRTHEKAKGVSRSGI